MSNLNVIYNAVVKMVTALSNISYPPVLSEVCDFGDSYGFLFVSPDKYTNQYWCVDKKTYRPFNFTENQDIKKYISRRIITLKREEGRT